MNNWESYFLSLAGSATVALPGYAVFAAWKVREALATKPLKDFWGPLLREGLGIVTAEEEREPDIKSQVFDFLVAGRAQETFTKYRQYRGRFERTDCAHTQNVLTQNLLLVGGPVPNDLTRQVKENDTVRKKLRYVFKVDLDPTLKGTRDGNQIVDISTSTLKKAAAFNGDVVVNDQGIITCIGNPFNTSRRVVITEGCYGWGTWGALMTLLEPDDLRRINEQKASRFQLLISVPVYMRTPGHPFVDWDSFVKLD